MKGIDSNVLIRYIMQDDTRQSLAATHFIEQKCSVDTPGFICGIVLCELVWVFETAYKQDKKSIGTLLEHLLKIPHFQIENSNIVWRALYAYRQEGVDFSDAYIAGLNAAAACDYTVTFDKKACRLKEFKLL